MPNEIRVLTQPEAMDTSEKDNNDNSNTSESPIPHTLLPSP